MNNNTMESTGTIKLKFKVTEFRFPEFEDNYWPDPWGEDLGTASAWQHLPYHYNKDIGDKHFLRRAVVLESEDENLGYYYDNQVFRLGGRLYKVVKCRGSWAIAHEISKTVCTKEQAKNIIRQEKADIIGKTVYLYW